MDIVERLRRQASQQDMLMCEDMLQAADEMARLRSELAAERERCEASQIKAYLAGKTDERERSAKVCDSIANKCKHSTDFAIATLCAATIRKGE